MTPPSTAWQLSTPVGFPGVAGQRALRALANLVIDVMARGSNVTDQARQIADKMAANATH